MNIATACVIKKQLNESIKGKKIIRAAANQNPHRFVWFAMEPARAFCDAQDAGEVEKYLTGKTIEQIKVNTGGYGFFNFLYVGNRALISDITPRFYYPNEKYAKRHQLLLEFEDGSHISYTASLGGAMFLFEVDENGDAIGYKSDFPLINTDKFTYEMFKSFFHNPEKRVISAKKLLATRNRIPGLDNNLLQDILWEAKINPKRNIDTLTEEDIQRIYKAIRTVPDAIIKAGGKDVDKDVYGNFGEYPSRVSRNTVGKPCARCGTAIVKEAFLGGAVYYCPKCQSIK